MYPVYFKKPSGAKAKQLAYELDVLSAKAEIGLPPVRERERERQRETERDH